jgi:hypothetical protein
VSGEAGAVASEPPRAMPALTEAYEQLRRAATESSRRDASLQGLGIFIQKGMAAWMSACTAVTPPMATPVTGDALHMLPSAQRDVIDVLAAMALTTTPEVRT